jgi:hypothetical protein
MHTATELSSTDFATRVDGRDGRLADVLPDFGEQDRTCAVVRHTCGALRASALILVAVTGFYDVQSSHVAPSARERSRSRGERSRTEACRSSPTAA